MNEQGEEETEFAMPLECAGIGHNRKTRMLQLQGVAVTMTTGSENVHYCSEQCTKSLM